MCAGCLFEKRQTTRIPETIVIKRCRHCGKYISEEMASYEIKDVVDREMKKIFTLAKKSGGIKSVNYEITDGNVEVSLKFDFNGMQKSEEHEIKIKERQVMCKYCGMARTRYYNAVLQIRAADLKGTATREVLSKALDIAREAINAQRTDEMAFIADIRETDNGVDVYVGSKSAARKAAYAVKKKFGAKLSITRKSGGRKMGKSVYRDTILVLI